MDGGGFVVRHRGVSGNEFRNCTIDGGEYLFNSGRPNHGNEIIDSIIVDIRNLKSGNYDLNAEYRNSIFRNNGFPEPQEPPGTEL